MAERKGWNPTPAILQGVAFGVAGGVMILATGLGDEWGSKPLLFSIQR